MENNTNKFSLSSFEKGFNKGKEVVVKQIEKFIEDESKFIPDIHSDALLDRLVKFIKKL